MNTENFSLPVDCIDIDVTNLTSLSPALRELSGLMYQASTRNYVRLSISQMPWASFVDMTLL